MHNMDLDPPKCARDAIFALAEMHIMDLHNAYFEQFALLKLSIAMIVRAKSS